ncbi:MAG TPA: SIS domain-containing protein [Solirubrobacteraceae bacterium]|nr:SIS domain-containing protein [Solirubrobacteraceae bacterium]
MSVTLEEIESQPSVWRQAAETALDVAPRLPPAGRRIAIVGCGTSYYIAQSVAVARESAAQGESDAFVASEMPTTRTYDAVLAISRSGTTTEVARALKALPAGIPSLAISAVPRSPVVEAASDAILLPFADEESIVQTRFATAVLALMRAALGHDLAPAIETAEASLAAPLPVDPAEFEHFVFLGHGWTVGLAFEAALKFRETSGAWAEAYPGMEYRHGPISVAGPNTLVWFLGVPAPDLAEAIRVTGATVAGSGADPMAELVTLQRMAVALAQSRGLDPDRPQHLTRSVVLP